MRTSRPLASPGAALLAVLACAACASQSSSVVHPGPAEAAASGNALQGPALDSEAAMAAALELAQPGPEHAELMALSGTWTVESALALAPGAEPRVETGRTLAKPALGGRFLELSTAGELFGMPTQSLSYLGFDRRRGVYVLVGLDSLGTYFVTAEGPRGDDGVIRMSGRDPDPAGDQVFRFEFELDGPDAYTMRVVFEELQGQRFDPPYVMVTNRSRRVAGPR